MENVHNAIAWYQKKIGSYDKQLWEQSVEKKLQKQPPFVLHNAPSKKVRLKTEYIDVDLIRGSTFAKAKPQVPWVYITRKAVARVLFFPFYYNWWAHQTSKQLYAVLLVLYVLQVLTIIVYLRNFDHSIMEDELSFTEVILPTILMFLLCLIHSQTVLAHINHKPPKRSKSISGVTRKPKPKKVQRNKGRTSGNNSTCVEDGCNTDTSKPPKPASGNPTGLEAKAQEGPPVTLDMEKNLMSRSVSDYDLKPMTSSRQDDSGQPTHHHISQNCPPVRDVRPKTSHFQGECRRESSHPEVCLSRRSSHPKSNQNPHPTTYAAWGPNPPEASQATHKSAFSYNLLNNLPNLLTVEKVCRDTSDNDDTEDGDNDVGIKLKKQETIKCVHMKSSSCGGDPACGAVTKSKSYCGSHLSDGAHCRFVDDASRKNFNLQGYTDFTMEVKAAEKSDVFHCRRPHREPKPCRDKGKECACQSQSGRKPDLALHHELSISEPCACKPESAAARHREEEGDVSITQLPWQQGICSCHEEPDHKTSGGKCSVLSKAVSTSTSGIADIHDFSPLQETKSAKTSPMYENGLTMKHSNLSGCVQSKGCISCVVQHNGLRHTDKSLKNYHVTFSCNQTNEPNVSHSWPEVFLPQSAHGKDKDCGCHLQPKQTMSDTDTHLRHFSDAFVQDLLNEETLREMSCSSLLAHSDLENSSSSFSHFSNSSSSISSLSSSYRVSNIDHASGPSPMTMSSTALCSEIPEDQPATEPSCCYNNNTAGGETLDESLEQINLSDGERPSDVSNYNPSDSDGESDVPENEELVNKLEEKWKKLRFQEQVPVKDLDEDMLTQNSSSLPMTSSANKSGALGTKSDPNGGPRSVVGILTRKPSPLKDLALGRTTNSNAAANSSGSEIDLMETRSQLRRRRRASGAAESGEGGGGVRARNVPSSLGIRHHDHGGKHLSSSENETGGHTPEGSNKATMSSEEWEDHMQSDETTSSNYSSSCGNSDDSGEEGEEKTEYTTSTLHVINLLQPGLQPGCLPHVLQTSNGLLTPGITTNQSFTFRKPQQSGSPTSSGTITQSDKVACVIWEGNECKKIDLTALDIGWAIIDKVDSLPESSDYFLIGLLFSVIIGLVPLVFRVYVNKELARWEDFITWSGILAQLSEVPSLIFNTYSWRQYLLMMNGIVQRFFLSLIFFFLLSVADRTFKQRLLYAKHFSYLTSSRRARKFAMPHFRLNKVRNIKIWLSLRSYLKRRGPQRSVDVIVSASFMCAICTVCLISLQMLKDTESYLDYLCNWELLVWCIGLGVFLMRFMTVGLKINKKYRNLSVLITEQINLYLQMEQKPHKKEELILANNVLRLAEDLLKELESPFKISGFSANPLIYNIMRVVVLSAFSAVLTEVLGFKLKLHKIKLKG